MGAVLSPVACHTSDDWIPSQFLHVGSGWETSVHLSAGEFVSLGVDCVEDVLDFFMSELMSLASEVSSGVVSCVGVGVVFMVNIRVCWLRSDSSDN